MESQVFLVLSILLDLDAVVLHLSPCVCVGIHHFESDVAACAASCGGGKQLKTGRRTFKFISSLSVNISGTAKSQFLVAGGSRGMNGAQEREPGGYRANIIHDCCCSPAVLTAQFPKRLY